MKFLRKNSATMLAVLLFILVIMGYKYLFKADLNTETDVASAVGSDLINLSYTLQSVSLDRSLFSKPSYRSLRDFSTPTTPQPVGRPNPFNVIGR